MILLSDSQMQQFIVNGYVTVKADFPSAFHESVRAQAEAIFASKGNPGNDILPAIPQLSELFSHPAVTGALTSILGPGYAMHPHRHCHLTPPSQSGQRHHQDSYEADQNVRHHRTRWAMAFYYPQHVTEEMGPTSVLPASQYYTSPTQSERKDEALLCGEAGTVTIVHYDLWHRATTNHSHRNRYMMKFLFCRMTEPAAPAWNCSNPRWRDPVAGRELSRLWQSVWNWHLGSESLDQAGNGSLAANTAVPGPKRLTHNEVDSLPEADRLREAYRLSGQGENGSTALMANLAEEVAALHQENLAAPHTNPSQLVSCFGLSAQGAAAVPRLVSALTAEDWPLRAAAADILGDIGLAARTAVPSLIDCLEDDSKWVRRNAVEALGNIASPEAVRRLSQRLTNDSCHFVRHNAALSLTKIGPDAKAAASFLQAALVDSDLYVRENARLALARIRAS